MTEILWRDHYGLHRTGWGDRLVPEAMAHPAKVRPDLAQKIVSHALSEGWWHRGDTLVDPFMGIGGFGLVAGWNGLRVVGVELEAHFVALVEANIALHKPLWGRDGCVAPVVIHGDSRNLRALVGAAMGSVSSPPYAEQVVRERHADGEFARLADKGLAQGCGRGKGVWDAYGSTPGNLGNLPCGSVSSPPYGSGDSAGAESLSKRTDASAKAMLKGQGWTGGGQVSDGNLARLPMAGSVSSPPYADDAPGAGGLNTKPPRDGSDDQSGRKAGPSQRGVAGCVSSPPYAESLQNPGGSRTPNAPEGFTLGASTPGVAGSVSSPPFQGCGMGAATEGHNRQVITTGTPTHAPDADLSTTSYGKSEGQLGEMPAGSVSSPPYEEGGGHSGATDRDLIQSKGIRIPAADYGDTAGQLGNERGTTFWDALREIATELHALLPPGAVSAWVVKDFVRKGKRVPFCDDCCTLLEQAGFTVFERWRCWMRREHRFRALFTHAAEAVERDAAGDPLCFVDAGGHKWLTHVVGDDGKIGVILETQVSRTEVVVGVFEDGHIDEYVVRVSEQKGFFRRLAEAKGSPRIDWEEAIWFAKEPATAAPPT